MNTLRLLKFSGTLLAIFLSAAGIYLSATDRLWLTAAACTGVFFGLCAYLYRMQTQPLRAVHRFIERKCTGGQKELPWLGPEYAATGHDIEKAFEHMLADYNRQLSEEAARLKHYEVLLENVDTGVITCGADGTVYWKNKAAMRIIGTRGSIPTEWFRQQTAEGRVIQIKRHDTPQEILFSATRFSQDGQVRLLCTLKNIRNILDEQQIVSWKVLTRVLTHEIMNSITPILSLSETLAARTYGPSPDQKDFQTMQQAMQTIHRRSKGLADFVEKYRKLTRLPAPQYTEIHVDELFGDLHKLFNRPDITFEQPYPGFTFRADRGQMEQVLINLIKNAIEASDGTDKGIQVRLSRDMLADDVVISVQDHGQGIPEDVQERLFVPFYTTKPTGSGIGLNLCKQILNAHHGHISVRSAVGKGSCFTLCLPRNGQPEPTT